MHPKHVTNLELSKQLFEAGITKDFESEFVWRNHYLAKTFTEATAQVVYIGDEMRYGDEREIPALLLSELLELMPVVKSGFSYSPMLAYKQRPKKGWKGSYEVGEYKTLHRTEVFSTPLEALSSLASYLLREGKFNNNKK